MNINKLFMTAAIILLLMLTIISPCYGKNKKRFQFRRKKSTKGNDLIGTDYQKPTKVVNFDVNVENILLGEEFGAYEKENEEVGKKEVVVVVIQKEQKKQEGGEKGEGEDGKPVDKKKEDNFVNQIMSRKIFKILKKEKLSKPSKDNPLQMQDDVIIRKIDGTERRTKLYNNNKTNYNTKDREHKYQNYLRDLKKYSNEWVKEKILRKFDRLTYLKKLEAFTYSDLSKWIKKRIPLGKIESHR